MSVTSTVELLNIAEVATLLRISEVSVRRLQSDRHIPFTKIGGSVRFLKGDIIAYIMNRRVEVIE
jgi:excisionase family DNA binding protein